MKGITLADIAKVTGYSVNTISHALHDKPDISEKTKKIIVKKAEEMGHIANITASALRSGKTKSNAIIVGDIANPYFSIMSKKMERRLREYNYCCIRTPLIPGITDTQENLTEIKTLIGDMKLELLEYNPFAEAKYKMFGASYPYNQFKQY